MSNLRCRNGQYHVCFRYGGKRYIPFFASSQKSKPTRSPSELQRFPDLALRGFPIAPVYDETCQQASLCNSIHGEGRWASTPGINAA